jgi:hypothetical protein
MINSRPGFDRRSIRTAIARTCETSIEVGGQPDAEARPAILRPVRVAQCAAGECTLPSRTSMVWGPAVEHVDALNRGAVRTEEPAGGADDLASRRERRRHRPGRTGIRRIAISGPLA